MNTSHTHGANPSWFATQYDVVSGTFVQILWNNSPKTYRLKIIIEKNVSNIGGMIYISSVRETLRRQEQSYKVNSSFLMVLRAKVGMAYMSKQHED